MKIIDYCLPQKIAKNWRNCYKIAKISFKYTLYNCEILGKLQDLNRSIQGMKFIILGEIFGQAQHDL